MSGEICVADVGGRLPAVWRPDRCDYFAWLNDIA